MDSDALKTDSRVRIVCHLTVCRRRRLSLPFQTYLLFFLCLCQHLFHTLLDKIRRQRPSILTEYPVLSYTVSVPYSAPIPIRRRMPERSMRRRRWFDALSLVAPDGV